MDPSEAVKPVMQVGETVLTQGGFAAWVLFMMLCLAVFGIVLLWRSHQTLMNKVVAIVESKARSDVELSNALTKLSERIGVLIRVQD